MPSINPNRKVPLPAAQLRAVAVAAEVDPRSLRKFLLGEPVIHLVRQRIERALRARGLKALVEAPAGEGLR